MTLTAPRMTAAIVLAGGRASRFGSDKLAAPMPDGRSVLTHAVAAVADVADLVAVVVSTERPLPLGLPPVVVVVRDRAPFHGPAAGLLDGLEAIGATADSLVIVAAGDMPWMVPDVLRLLLDALAAEPTMFCARLGSPTMEGPAVLLPCTLRLGAARAAARRAVADEDSRLRHLIGGLATVFVDRERWSPIDPDGWTARDVDRPADLGEGPAEVGFARPGEHP